ncbi:MAG: N-acetylmuramoyl-L-alanine amidase [Solirubrobacteraceae bacterium]|nr:N-acetylmuramoyl-L-alanine amidase [Patulibacter sp.]
MQQRWLIAVLALIVIGAGLLTRRGAGPDLAAAHAATGSLAGKTIHVDAGHNGGNASHATEINRLVDAGGGVRKACDTTGTETNDGKLTEYAFTLDVALRLRKRLEARGARVVMTRTTSKGVGPCITRRAAIGNEAHADAAVSIHADGGPSTGRGFDVIQPGGVSGQSHALIASSALLGRRVRNALVKEGYRTADYVGKDGLDRRTDLGGLNLSKVPKVLVELGNMRNAADAKLLESGTQRARMADALATAIAVQVTH